MHIPNLDSNTIIIIVGAVVILIALLVMGGRLKSFIFKGSGFNASADAGTPGSKVTNTKVRGNLNKVKAKGHGNVVGNINARIGKDDEP